MHATARPVASIAASVEIRRVTIAPSRGSVETEVVLLITRQTAGFWLIAGGASQEWAASANAPSSTTRW
jgi:hypothetical protein